MKAFTESKTCAGRQHCENCRNKEAGRLFRQNLKAIYTLPEDKIDFDCPFGVPWGFVGTASQIAPAMPPRNYVQVKVKPSPFGGPGSVVEIVLKKMGYTKSGSCGCTTFRNKMNAWGWWGCMFKHRAEIVDWFTAKAKEQNIPIDRDGIWALVRGGLKDLLVKRAEAHPSRLRNWGVFR